MRFQKRVEVIERDEGSVFMQSTCWLDPQKDITTYELYQCQGLSDRLSIFQDSRDWLWKQIDGTQLVRHFVFAKIKVYKIVNIPNTMAFGRTKDYYWE